MLGCHPGHPRNWVFRCIQESIKLDYAAGGL